MPSVPEWVHGTPSKMFGTCDKGSAPISGKAVALEPVRAIVFEIMVNLR